jgi:hypothetical protein
LLVYFSFFGFFILLNEKGIRLIGPNLKFSRPHGGEGGSHPSNLNDNPYGIGAINFTGIKTNENVKFFISLNFKDALLMFCVHSIYLLYYLIIII